MKIKSLITYIFVIFLAITTQVSFCMELTPNKAEPKKITEFVVHARDISLKNSIPLSLLNFTCGEEQISIKNTPANWDILQQSQTIKHMFEDLGHANVPFENIEELIPLRGINNGRDFNIIFGLMRCVHKNKGKYIETELNKSTAKELCSLVQVCNYYNISNKNINLTAVICSVIADKYKQKIDRLYIKQLPLDLHNQVARYRIADLITYIDHHGAAASFSYEKRWPISLVTFSLDGKSFAVGSWDTIVKLWDIKNKQCIRTFVGNADIITSVTFSPDGNIFAIGSKDGTVKIWDVNTGRCIKTCIESAGSIVSVKFSPDGKRFATGSWDGIAKIWDVETEQCVKTFIGHTDSINSILFNMNGTLLATGSYDYAIKIWNVETEKCLKTFSGHKYCVHSIAFNSDGAYLATGSYDETAKIWDIKSGLCIKIFRGHSGSIRSIAFSQNDEKLATGSWDETVKIWDIKSGMCIKTFVGRSGPIYSLAFSPDDKNLITGSGSGVTHIWNMEDTSKHALLSDLTLEQADFLIKKVYPVIKKNKIFKLETGNKKYKIFMAISVLGQQYLNPYIAIIKK